ncbi:hypothetical protein D9M68_762190 [compost metagenome]
MGQFQAGIGGVVAEGGGGHAALHLVVLVVAVADAQAAQLEPRQRFAVVAAQVPAALLHVDVGHPAAVVMGVGMLVSVVMLVFVVMAVPLLVLAEAVPIPRVVGVAVGMLVGQQAITVALLGVGQAQVAALADPATAEGRGIGVVVGAHLLVRTRIALGTGDPVLVVLALDAFDAHGELSGAGGQAKGTGAAIGNAVGA